MATFTTRLKAGEDFDVTMSTKDGSAEWLGVTVTCAMKPPTGSQINVTGTVSGGGAEVSFVVLGSQTINWQVGTWNVEIWDSNGVGSRREVASGTMQVEPSKVTVPA
jgi:hypothetical protein